jgi:epoxide hydrolase-like predicted phosphatase
MMTKLIPTIDTIIFDIGGVLVQTVDTAPRERWEREFGLPSWGLSDLVFGSAESRAAFIGEADADDVWRHVARELRLDAQDATAIARDFWAGDAVNAAHVALIERLRGRVRLGILSNAWRDMQARDARRIDFAQFDAVVYSCEEGVRKPDARIYQIALERLDAQPERTLFIDDFVENIEAANALGIQTIRYEKTLDLPAAVEHALTAA